ncbi:hypothetical protein CRYUN_Cryun07bG0155300 [Craigia yunnanensis]
MAISMSKKKSKASKKVETKKNHFSDTILFKIFYQIPAVIFLLILIFIWSSSTTIISGKFVHVCVSSRKLNNLYCLSAGTQPNFEIPFPVLNNSSISPNISSSIKELVNIVQDESDAIVGNRVQNNDSDGEVAFAVKVVEAQLQVQRSWISNKNNVASCDGRGIYVYNLPSKFNKDLVGQCGDMIPWTNFCKYFNNEAMGEPIAKLGKGWVYNGNEATLFYFPFYGGLDILRWHFKNVSNDVKDTLTLELVKWLENKRSWLQNSGAARPDAPENIRSILINQCNSDESKCRFLNCSSGGCDQPESVIELFMESEFCLQPPGDSPTRKSVFDSLVSGCIPVLFDPFTAYYQYPWHLPEDYSKYSVFIDQEEVRQVKLNVVEILTKVPEREREDIRRYIVYELLPGLVYGDSILSLKSFKTHFP